MPHRQSHPIPSADQETPPAGGPAATQTEHLQPEALRAQLYFLDPDGRPEDKALYEHLRFQFILSKEGAVPAVYKDVLGLVTVGVGFNMDRPEARAEWQEAFGEQGVSFDAVYLGARTLTEAEMHHLFQTGLGIREAALRDSYGEVWKGLRPNERLATESAYYNGACLVQGPTRDSSDQIVRTPEGFPQGATRYYCNLERYVLERNPAFLREAVVELRHRSNRRGIHGLALRRAAEADLLSSFCVEGFS